MSIKSQLLRSLYNTLSHSHEGAYATRADRQVVLTSTMKELVGLGYKIASVQQLKEKHITALVTYWQRKGLTVGTVKNRLAALRYLAKQIRKSSIIPSNKALQIGARKQIAISNKSIHSVNFARITDPHVQMSLQLQRVFGLRREESIKIRPHMADKNDKLLLLGAWCKGNRSREIPIRTEEQRYWLEQAKGFCVSPDQSLIPPHKSYIRHRNVYDKQLQRAGIRSHGLRHAYAQLRYQELTGHDAPIAGGPKFSELPPLMQQKDRWARMVLTEELGHSRLQITSNYLG
ncbi:MAG TPA: phage integrase N-terminal domain-containing protein [Gammaproteobacteria bacterium]|nr:phage integrase N-terminal domain-containing protein [Gammaproteobacteria bacterium]HVY53694.1 phage integrase N-terminal domain-containing protein [Gammaproteobacteria bacterium]